MVDEEDIENGSENGSMNFGTWRQEIGNDLPGLAQQSGNRSSNNVRELEKSSVTISIQMVKLPGSGTFCNLPDLIVILLAQFVF